MSTVQTVIDRMVEVCRERKRRVRERQADLLGRDWKSYPSRGAILPNGKRCLRWHFWTNARTSHLAAHLELRDMIQATGCKPTKAQVAR